MFELSQNKIKFELTKRELRKLNTLKNKVSKLNNDLREYLILAVKCRCLTSSVPA